MGEATGWKRFVPEQYRKPEFPAETLLGETVRRISWKACSPSMLQRFWRSLLLSDDGYWCFVLGVNNSGTTLLHDLLARSPDIRSLPRADLLSAEGQWHTNAIPLARDYGVARLFSARPDVFRWTEDHDPGPAVRALHDWGFHYARESGKVLLEKSPPNTIRARWLQANFTRPRFIAMVRHPCAVAEGIRRRTDCDIRQAARHWSRANRLLLKDLPELEHWTGVQYEQFCLHPSSTLERLANFLSVSGRWKDEDLVGLDVHSLDESVETIENFNPRSFERLSEEDMNIIASEAGAVAARFGYSIPPTDDRRDRKTLVNHLYIGEGD